MPLPVVPLPVVPVPVVPVPVVPVPVVLDVDTGVDDALALLVAACSPLLELRAVTCVAGNAPLERVLPNTLAVLEAAGAPGVPVAAGADRPLGGQPPARPRAAHGRDGLAGLDLRPRRAAPVDRPAVDLLVAALDRPGPPAVVLGLAPPTNLALLLRDRPRITGRIARIVLVGGFNVDADPRATTAALASGVPLTRWDAGALAATAVTAAEADLVAAGAGRPAGGRAAGPSVAPRLPGVPELAAALLRHQAGRGAGLGDAAAVAGVLDPAAVRTTRDGAADVVTDVDGERLRRLVEAALGQPWDVPEGHDHGTSSGATPDAFP